MGDGKFRKVKCKCQHGLCTPVNLPTGANSCEVICGVNPCKQGNSPTETCKYPNYKGDSYCDDENNNAGCAWDGGDCCGANVKIHQNNLNQSQKVNVRNLNGKEMVIVMI